MDTRTHEAILMEQFNAVLDDLKLCLELYDKTRGQGHLVAAAQKWGVLTGLAMAAQHFGIVSLKQALDQLNFPTSFRKDD